MKQINTRHNIIFCNGVIRKGFKNTLKCSSGKSETIHHKIMKFWIANYCWERDLTFWSEATFINGQRADIIIGNWKVAVEVLHSEGKELKSSKDYPVDVLLVYSTESVEEVEKKLSDFGCSRGE